MTLHSRIAPVLPSTLVLDVPPPPARRRRMRPKKWLAWTLAISLLLHLLALLVIFYTPKSDDESQATAPAEWQIEMQPDRDAGAPAPSTVSPSPLPTPPPPSEAKTVTPPQPQPQQAPPPPQAQVQETKPAPTQAPPVLSSHNAVETAPEKPAAAKPTPKPAPSPFANIQENKDFFLPRTSPPPPSQNPQKQSERGGVNLALGKIEHYDMSQPTRRSTDIDSDVQVSGADIGPDWMRELHVWWIDHRRYPAEARRNFEQGDVVIRFDVDRSGLTSHAEILQHSTSQWLDAQTMATFGHAHLPPLPPSSPEDHKTVTITVRYILN